ncbi:MAG: hypothetical protein ABH854_04640 [Candidatus Diapherotrites archaeon]|nr:hypothetical protein [Candidatus Micrarchaeota archaeon]MBU1939678.1 hypothetical protein [Candidatus Micrarchaeota archaeon]
MNSENGFMFTIDAMFAILLVVALAALFAAYFSIMGAESHALQMHEQLAGDDAMLGAYGIGPANAATAVTKEFGTCYTYFEYDSGVKDYPACREGFNYG